MFYKRNILILFVLLWSYYGYAHSNVIHEDSQGVNWISQDNGTNWMKAMDYSVEPTRECYHQNSKNINWVSYDNGTNWMRASNYSVKSTRECYHQDSKNVNWVSYDNGTNWMRASNYKNSSVEAKEICCKFSPCPAMDKLNITWSENIDTIQSIYISNLSGDIVYQYLNYSTHSLILDVSGWIPGTYYLSMIYNNSTINKQFIVLK